MDPTEAKTITIKDIEIRTQVRRNHLIARQYQIEFSVGVTPRLTRKAKETKNRTLWDEKFIFDGYDRSVLTVRVYQKRHIGKDELVGSLVDTIDGVLGKWKDGVLEELLSKGASEPNPSDITIRFMLVAEPFGGVDADDRQATEAVARAIKAVCATSSMPTDADISPGIDMVNNVVAGVQTFETTWSVLLDRLELFNQIVSSIAQIHPYASLAWSVISAANQVLVRQKNRDERIVRLMGTMSDVLAFVHDAEPLRAIKAHKKTITLLIQQVTECGYFITEYAKSNSFLIRTATSMLSDIDGTIMAYENTLRELKAAFLEGVTVHTGIVVVRMMNEVEHIAESIDLNDMPYAFGARYTQEKGCLPGTCESFLGEICDVLNNPNKDAPRVCLLTGVAGSGKSAVAHSIAQLYDGQKRLGSSFCFASTDVARRNPQNLFSTIARDLSDHDPQYKSALWEVVKENRALRTSGSPLEQVERLIIEPSENLFAIGPMVIVIDALDESGDQASRRPLLRAISKQITENSLPANLCFLITARPENDILSALLSAGSNVVHKQMGDIPQDVVDEDIQKFIYHSLQYTDLESYWPNQEWCRLLVHHSQHLFQWASTACNFVEGLGAVGLSPSERLDILLQKDDSSVIHPLDELYQTILRQLFTLDKARQALQNVMAILFSLREPLSLKSLSALFPLNKDLNIRDIIKPMGSLLDGVHDDEKPIRPLHTSFRDFLLDETRSHSFYVCMQPRHSLRLGQALLSCMRNMLRFNICHLEDARTFNAAIPHLPRCIKEAIPTYLAYSCQYWMIHLEQVDCTQDLSGEVTLFFKDYLPYWLEGISLLSLLSPLVFILSALETCTILKKWTKDEEIATLASETFQFVQVFAPVLRKSTPHLYLSTMPQTPPSSLLYGLWQDHLQRHISVKSGQPASWPAEIHVMHGHTDYVQCVAYSPQGTCIASSSGDMCIRIWDSTTGQLIAKLSEGHGGPIWSIAFSPDGNHIVSGSAEMALKVWNVTTGQGVVDFQGHSGSITTVAYSPDGVHIASGSYDRTVRVWNAVTGHPVAGSLKGHTSRVWSIAYSPDGTNIASGSADHTVRIWNASTGQLIAGPFRGHIDAVTSVSYSPDGEHIASASLDKTIQIWSATTGQLVLDPFQGHTSPIWSVSYSPDGTHVVSGSRDKTIRIWNATTGQSVAGPLEGHTNAVWSVAYSPDGTHIVSGSEDHTLRVWNATASQSTASVTQPEEYTDFVMSVSFSPDGAHVVSGYWDKTIKVWDATMGQSMAGPFWGHTDSILSVVYAPDGTCIASGSWDGTVRVWDAVTGHFLASPFEGHLSPVWSIAYSPDGTCIVSGSEDRTIRVWDAVTGQLVAGPLEGHTGSIWSVSYSPDGTQIISGSEDGTIRIWHAVTGKSMGDPLQLEGHKSSVKSVLYSPDGSCIISGSEDGTIGVWNATTGQLMSGPFHGHEDSVESIAYSPNGIHIVTGSKDKTIRIWDVTTGQTVAGPFQGHTSFVNSVAYSPDGRYIVSGSLDHYVKVWRVEEFASFDNLYEKDGWVQTSGGACFGWIAPWNRHDFCLPIHSLIISSNRTYQHHVDCSLFGTNWASCWN